MSKRYTDQLKAEVVRAALDEYRSSDELETMFDVPRGTFGAWIATERAVRREKADQARREAVPAPVSAELTQLRKQTQILSSALGEIQGILIFTQNELQ